MFSVLLKPYLAPIVDSLTFSIPVTIHNHTLPPLPFSQRLPPPSTLPVIPRYNKCYHVRCGTMFDLNKMIILLDWELVIRKPARGRQTR